MKEVPSEDYFVFDKILCPIVAINHECDVIFLNKTAKETYLSSSPEKQDKEIVNESLGKCYNISHGYDKPCYEMGERCPLVELKENKDENISSVIHNHKGHLYKVEAFRDEANPLLFFESHTNITDFISEIESVKKAKEESQSTEKKLETFFDNLPVPSLIIDVESGLIIDANKKAVEFYGYSKEEFAHMTIAVINPFISIEETIDFRAKSLNEGYNFAIFKHKLKNGEIRDVEAHISGIVYNNKSYIQVVINDITEKKILEDKLKESEETFRTLAENMPIGLDMHTDKFIYVNPALQDMLGYTEEELKDKYFWDVLAEEHKETAKDAIKKGLTNIGYKHYVTFKVLKKTGEELWMYIYAGSVIFKGKTVRIASWTDVTEQEKLKEALQKSLKHNIALTQFNVMLKTANQIIAKVKDEKKLFNEICYIVRQYSSIRLVWIGRPDEKGLYKVLAKSGEIGYLDGLVVYAGEDLPEGQGVMGQVWRSKKPIFNFDFFKDQKGEPWRKRAKIYEIARSSAIPIFKKGEIYAAITFYLGSGEIFDEEIESVLLQLAADIGFALDRMDDEITKEDLRKFNEILLSNLTVGINVLRYPERVVELVNERNLQIYGAHSLEDMVGHPMREFFPDSESYEKVGKLAETILSKGEGLLNDVPYLRLDGSLIYVDISGQKLPSKPGEPERIVWTEVDVTERHKNQETIRKLIESQDALLSNTATGIVLIRHPEKVIIEANRGFLNILGYSNKEEVLGRFTKDIFYPDDEDSIKQMLGIIQEALINGSAYLKDIKMKRKDGVIIYVDVSGQRLLSEQEHPLIVWTFMDVTERHNLMEELSRQSITDSLTNLPNRRALDAELERAVERANRNEKLMAICMLDLDGFKQINDTYGHDAGDLVLKVISDRLKKGLRKTDFVARLGGDEFVLLIEYLNDIDTLERIIDKIGDLVLEPININDNTNTSVKVGLSMGVILYPFSYKGVDNANAFIFADSDTGNIGNASRLYNPLELIRLSDQALYEVKAHKADRSRFWTYYGSSVPVKLNRYQLLLRQNRVKVFYQPILDNVSRNIVGVEALARLNDYDGAILTPDKFLHHLNDEDLFELTRQVFLKSLEDIKIIDKDNKDLRLWASVNLTPSSLNNKCLNCLKEALSKSDIDPQRITFEILEGGEFLDKQDAARLLSELRSIGVKIALDDIGSAYSSLLRMRTLPIDEIKLDQTFVRTLEEHPEDLNFVLAIQELAENFDFDLVVEGVETDDILDALTVLNTGSLQGYAIARPMPLEDLIKFISKPPVIHRTHPISLMGIYIEQMIHQNAVRKMVENDPELLNDLKWKNADLCIIGKHLKQIGIPEGSPIDTIHRNFHNEVANLDVNLIKTHDPKAWNGIYEAQEKLLKAIYEEYIRIKTNSSRTR